MHLHHFYRVKIQKMNLNFYMYALKQMHIYWPNQTLLYTSVPHTKIHPIGTLSGMCEIKKTFENFIQHIWNTFSFALVDSAILPTSNWNLECPEIKSFDIKCHSINANYSDEYWACSQTWTDAVNRLQRHQVFTPLRHRGIVD